jgi:UDP-glucose 4-epimerase
VILFVLQVAVGRREKVFVFGNDYPTKDGTGVRDYIHITDLAIGHLKALEKMSEPTFLGWKAYNLGTGRGYSVLDLINAFTKASGKKINYEIVERREGDIASSFADAALAKNELKWVATRGVDDMCKDTWKWQKQNPHGFHK